MKIKTLKNKRDYNAALKRADEVFMLRPDTPQGEELALLLLAV